ncbi:aspartate/tyrosine/aromatic aminotransferase [Owenweeksia hongkongensis DSM 17368]|uniref:Aspartate/tyrosine/aromatic aminotransferase n=1 Tax=Owenweeksia hongkongensis (strain DSM 17368 / CIP 108786 / JCM 12287 / NRRL B-23963 / UST20020801) TaxID=926562 RepID=G8R8V8_OWEHD|nr:methionine aminotransferase [Owenweeksia hongkongensis]AEV33566.1 aspartate/tyrosine/aromatic aminotransferase [Owenweeksia hongkongensis DSM 17368]
MSQTIKSKLPNTGDTIFSVMSALAAEHNAINLSQGFPDFETDPVLLDLVNKYMHRGLNQYAPMPGVPELRQVVSDMVQRQTGHSYNPENEVTITHGATEAIAAAISCCVREGDEVIIFTPAYDCYAPMVELNGGTPIFVQLEFPNYNINWDIFKKQMTHRTKLIIINTPHNPSATLISKEDLVQLQEIVEGTNMLILSDEVYENIVFDGNEHHSASSFPALAERSFKIGSFGKSLHVTGWKLGYCAAPAQLMAEFRKVHQYMVFAVNTPMQYAIAEYLQHQERLEISAMYEGKRNTFLKAIEGSGFKPLPSKGTYFQLLDYSAISDKNEVEFAKELTTKHFVASIPMSVFYHIPQEHHVLRFCFAKNEETLHKAGSLLKNIG